MKKQEFGAGIWHFATYLDRYATDGYGEPRSVIEAIELAGKVTDLSYVDINYPYFGGEFSNEQIKKALDKAGLKVIGITPEDTKAVETTFPVYRDKSRSFSKKPYASYLDHFLLLRRDKYIAATSQVNNHCEIIDKITKLT